MQHFVDPLLVCPIYEASTVCTSRFRDGQLEAQAEFPWVLTDNIHDSSDDPSVVQTKDNVSKRVLVSVQPESNSMAPNAGLFYAVYAMTNLKGTKEIGRERQWKRERVFREKERELQDKGERELQDRG